MEFFGEIAKPAFDSDALKQLLTIARLTRLCKSIDSIILDEKDRGIIYSVWGQHDVQRVELTHGVRFSLINCPNALAWSVTRDVAGDNIVVHCTINTKDHDADFVESIEIFVSDWLAGLEQHA